MDDYDMEDGDQMDGYGDEMDGSGMVQGDMMDEEYGDEGQVSVTPNRLNFIVGRRRVDKL